MDADSPEIAEDTGRRYGTTETEIEYTLPPESETSGFSEEDQAKIEAQTGNLFQDLANGNIPLGNFIANGAWSLLSLMLSLASLILTARIIIGAFRRKDEIPGQYEREFSAYEETRILKLLAVILGLATPALWGTLDDLSQPVTWINRWTAPVGVLFLAHALVCLKLRKTNAAANQVSPDMASD
jgi:hypothetical protein